MKGLLLVVVMGALAIGTLGQKTNINQGYNLLKSLQDTANIEISEVDDQWSKTEPLLKQNVDSWAKTVADQTTLCDSRSNNLGKTNRDIENSEHYIVWIQNQLDENRARIKKLEEDRCTANNLYIETLKNSQLALSIIDFLIAEITKVDNMDMLQKSQVMNKLTMFVEAYKLGNVATLLDAPVFAQFKTHLENDGEDFEEEEDNEDEQLEEIEDELDQHDDQEGNVEVHVDESEDDEEEEEEEIHEEESDTEEDGEVQHLGDEDFEKYDKVGHEQNERLRNEQEIGRGHVDNNRENIKVREIKEYEGQNWGDYKNSLLGILTELKKTFEAHMKNSQDDEIAAGIALAEFKIKIEAEDNDLEEALVDQHNTLERLQILKTKQEILLTECKAELETVSNSLKVSQDELAEEGASYEENRRTAVETRDIFDYVVSIYEGGVKGEGEQYQWRNDDDVYQSRQLDDIGFLPDN